MTQKKQGIKSLDAPNYGRLNALYMAFYSRKLYADVGMRWRGLGLTYMLLLVAIFAIPLSLYLINKLNDFYDDQLLYPLTHLPTIVIQDGQVQFDKPMPYFVKNDKGDIIAAVDTTGQIKTITNKYPQLRVLITKDKIFYHQPSVAFFNSEQNAKVAQFPVQEQSLKNQENAIISGSDLAGIPGITHLKFIFDIFVYPALTGFVYSVFACMLLAFALLGQLFAKAIFKHEISYSQSARLMMVASTPVIALYFVVIGFGLALPGGSGIINAAVLAIYFSYGIISVKRESKKLARL